MFGDKHKKLTALAGVEASAITDEQLNGINADLDAQNITGVRVISTSYLNDAEASVAKLTTAQEQIMTLTNERDQAVANAKKFGSQPGHLGSKAEKVEETQSASDDEKVISEMDAELAAQDARINRL